MNTNLKGISAAMLAGAFGLMAAPVMAEPGGYVGASIGNATIEARESLDGESISFDESDFGFKIFGGFNFTDNWGVEVGYVDLGAPDDDFTFVGTEPAGGTTTINGNIEAEVTGFTLQGVGILPVGPVDLFAKAGVVFYDADLKVSATDGFSTFSESLGDDGQELVYGGGAAMNFGNFAVRAEVDLFDIDDVDDVYLLSIGAVLRF